MGRLEVGALLAIDNFRQLFLIFCVGLVQVLHVSKNSHWKFGHVIPDRNSKIVNNIYMYSF